jgi:D-glutamate cyclase
MPSVFETLEAIAGRRVRRDIDPLVAVARGNLEKAARSIAEHPAPHVGIVAGFFVRHAEPPSPETDGLNGLGQLAAGLSEAGIEVTAISDAPCAKAVWAVTEALPHKIGLEIVSVSADSVRRLRRQFEQSENPITHLIASERCSLGADGKPHREHGWDISADTAPLDYLFEDAGWKAPWTTIGIGDGGNEIGMAVLPPDIVESYIPNGALIAARTGADFLIVSGVANWGAYALLAALAGLRPDLAPALLAHFNGDTERDILAAAVNIGQAIDDSRVDRLGQLQMTIDRLPLADHVAIIDELAAAVRAAA